MASSDAARPKRGKTGLSLFLLALIFVVLLAWLFTLGFFASLTPVESDSVPTVLIYESYQGAYGQTGVLIDKLYSALNKDKLKTHRTFSLYFDDPQKTGRARISGRVGCILEPADYERIPELSRKYTLMKLEPGKVLSLTVPYKNMVSIFIGATRAYPELRQYAAARGYHPKYFLEIYDRQNKQLIYLFQIERQSGP